MKTSILLAAAMGFAFLAGLAAGVWYEVSCNSEEIYHEYRRGYELGRETGRIEVLHPEWGVRDIDGPCK